jgi:hypothetical protein
MEDRPALPLPLLAAGRMGRVDGAFSAPSPPRVACSRWPFLVGVPPFWTLAGRGWCSDEEEEEEEEEDAVACDALRWQSVAAVALAPPTQGVSHGIRQVQGDVPLVISTARTGLPPWNGRCVRDRPSLYHALQPASTSATPPAALACGANGPTSALCRTTQHPPSRVHHLPRRIASQPPIHSRRRDRAAWTE